MGRYLLDTLNASGTSLDKEKLETLFNLQLQVSNCIAGQSNHPLNSLFVAGYTYHLILGQHRSFRSRGVLPHGSCHIILSGVCPFIPPKSYDRPQYLCSWLYIFATSWGCIIMDAIAQIHHESTETGFIKRTLLLFPGEEKVRLNSPYAI